MEDLLTGLGAFLPYVIGAGIVGLLVLLLRPRLTLPRLRVPHFLGRLLGHRFQRSQAAREGAALRRRGDFTGAARSFEAAGMLAEAADSYLQAGDDFHAATVRERQGTPEIAGELYRRAGDYRRAADLFVAAGRTDRAAELYQERGSEVEAAQLYGQAGQHAKAAELFARAGYHVWAAEAYERAGRLGEAAESYERDFSLQVGDSTDPLMVAPSARRSGFLAGRLYEQMGRGTKAQHVYARAGYLREAGAAASKRQDPHGAAEYYLAAGDPLAAAAAYERSGDTRQGARLRAEAALAGGRIAEAASYLQKSGAYHKAAEIFESLQMFERAATALEDAGDFAAAGASYLRGGLDRHAARAYEHAAEAQTGGSGSTAPPSAPAAGPHVFQPRFVLRAELAHGPLGVVFQADDRQTGHTVALRVLPRPPLADPELRQAVAGDVRSAAELVHPNLVRVLSLAEIEGRACVLEELTDDARDLSTALGAGLKISFEEAREVVRSLAAGLGYLHERGIVHGCVQPSSIRMSGGVVKLGDVGLSRLAAATGAADPRYQAPERLLDAASDIYSLAALLYRLVTGTDVRSVLEGGAPPPPPSHFAPAVPESFDRALVRALHPDRSLRFNSAAELVEALD